MKYYHSLGRLISPVMVFLFRCYTFINKTARARVLVFNEQGEVLLVRSWVGAYEWELPGGGVERNELPLAAARRELFEETGIRAPSDQFEYITTLHIHYEAPVYKVVIARSDLPSTIHNPWEITAIQWYAIDDLPSGTSILVRAALQIMSKTK